MKVYNKLLFFTADTFNETRVDEFLSGWFIIHDNLDLDNFDPMKFFLSIECISGKEGGGVSQNLRKWETCVPFLFWDLNSFLKRTIRNKILLIEYFAILK